MKEAIQKYQCKTCGQETEDKKRYLKEDCATRRLLKIITKYMEWKLTKITKFSKHQEIKVLLKKQLDTDESDFSDDISRDDNDHDSDCIPETPQNNTGKSIKQRKTHLKSHHLKRHHLKKTQSKARPLPFQKAKSNLSPKKKNQKSKKKKK